MHAISCVYLCVMLSKYPNLRFSTSVLSSYVSLQKANACGAAKSLNVLLNSINVNHSLCSAIHVVVRDREK